MLVYTDFSEFSSEEEVDVVVTLPEKVHHLEVCYDGGRLGLMVNGKEVYTNMCASNDFCLALT